MPLWVIYCTFGCCIVFLGHSKAPVLSSLMKLHCAGAHYDLFFSCVKKKSKHVHISLPTWDHVAGLRMLVLIETFPTVFEQRFGQIFRCGMQPLRRRKL